MTPKPKHNDIEKYGYFLMYSPSQDSWYAAYDAEKGTAWYIWSGNEFKLYNQRKLPNDLRI